jgi:Mce-associated membrane protein
VLVKAAPTVPPADQPSADQPSADPPPADDRAAAAPPRQAGLLLLVLVGLLTAVMVAGVAFLGLRLRAESQTEAARSEATVASRDAARLLFSYDHTTLEEDFAAGLSVTTGDFRDEYSRTTKDVVTELAEQYQAVVEATVVESAVVEASPDEVTVLVFLDQATTSTQISGRQVDQSRVRMRLVEREGRWLVAEVQAP